MYKQRFNSLVDTVIDMNTKAVIGNVVKFYTNNAYTI